MKIAVDVCVGRRGAEILREAGHVVLEAEHGESDSDWLRRTRNAGAQMFVAADADVEIFAYDHNIPFIKATQGESGSMLALRVLAVLKAKESR